MDWALTAAIAGAVGIVMLVVLSTVNFFKGLKKDHAPTKQ